MCVFWEGDWFNFPETIRCYARIWETKLGTFAGIKHQTWNNFRLLWVCVCVRSYAQRCRTCDNVIRIDRHLILISAHNIYENDDRATPVESKHEITRDGRRKCKSKSILLNINVLPSTHWQWECVTNCSISDTNHWLCNDFWLVVARVFSLSANKHDYMPCSHPTQTPMHSTHFIHDLMLRWWSQCSNVHSLYHHSKTCKYVGCVCCVDTLFLASKATPSLFASRYFIQYDVYGVTIKSRIRKFRVNWIDSSRSSTRLIHTSKIQFVCVLLSVGVKFSCRQCSRYRRRWQNCYYFYFNTAYWF